MIAWNIEELIGEWEQGGERLSDAGEGRGEIAGHDQSVHWKLLEPLQEKRPE